MEPPGEWVCPECQVCGKDRGGTTGRMGVPRVRYVGGIEAEPPGEWVCPECPVCGRDRGGTTGRMGVPRVSGMWEG